MSKTRNSTQKWKRPFFIIATGQAVSMIGSSAIQFAIIWWLAEQTGSPMVLSLSALYGFLPQLIIGPFAGVFVDRLKRKNVIIAADMFMGLVSAGFALLFYQNETLSHNSIYLMLALRSLGNVFHTPALQAAIPMLVPPEELMRANGYNQFIQSGCFMLGPVIGAALYAVLPLPIILLTDLIGAAAASIAVAAVKIPDPPKAAGAVPHFFRELKQGLSTLFSNRIVAILVIGTSICMIFFLPLSSLYPLMTSNYFNLSAWHAGVVEFLFAAGMMLVAAFSSLFGAKMKRKLLWLHAGVFLCGITCVISGIVPPTLAGFWVFAVSNGFLGGASNLYHIPFMAHLQEVIPNEAQGRVFSVISSLMSFAMPIGLLIAGPLAERYGVALLFLICGITFLVCCAISFLIAKKDILAPPRTEGEQVS